MTFNHYYVINNKTEYIRADSWGIRGPEIENRNEWECAYCGSVHTSKEMHCKECGAPKTIKRKYARPHAPGGGVRQIETEEVFITEKSVGTPQIIKHGTQEPAAPIKPSIRQRLMRFLKL